MKNMQIMEAKVPWKFIIFSVCVIIIFFPLSTYYVFKRSYESQAITKEYLQKNDYYISGKIEGIEHLNGTTHMFYIKIDSVAIYKQYTTDEVYWGFINYEIKEMVLFSFLNLPDYNWRKPDKNLLPNRISINVAEDEILYYKNDSIISKNGISVDTHISKRKFEERTKNLRKENGWIKF